MGVSLLRCFGRLREVVLDRELVVVFRPGGCSVFKLKLKYRRAEQSSRVQLPYGLEKRSILPSQRTGSISSLFNLAT